VVWPILPFIAVALVLAFAVSGSLDAMALGDDLAAAHGVRLARTRVLSVLTITLLAGGATAIAGPIVFVGLMVPHVARWIVGPNQGWIFAYSIVLAPSLVLASDILGRVVLRPGEIPVGIVTAFVGAPVLIALVRRKKASGL
jgi:ABC-type Fe3+-siderophore transport system permease subunit